MNRPPGLLSRLAAGSKGPMCVTPARMRRNHARLIGSSAAICGVRKRMIKELRPYQARAIENLRASLVRGNKRVVLQAPTGSGKTVCAGEIIRLARERDNRVIFTAPAISLIDQTVASLSRQGIADIGVIQQQHPLTNFDMPVQVASVQTLMRRTAPPAQAVIVDEAHLSFEYVYQWMGREPDKIFIGLSATPWAKGMGAPGRWQDLIIVETLQGLTEQGYLAPMRYLRPDMPDLSGVKTVAGDYHEGQLGARMRQKEILANTVNRWLEQGEGRPTIAFCVDRAHAQDVQRRFIECGVPWGYIDAKTGADERAETGRQIERGELAGVSSVGCLIVGVDWTFVSCVLHARPTKSYMLYIQSLGRGLRIHPGKKDCLVLDVAGNALRLSHPYSVHFDTLCAGTKKAREKRKAEEEKIPKAHICPSCGAVHARFNRICFLCGYEIAISIKPTDVIEGEADLIEISPGGIPTKNGRKLKPTHWPTVVKQEWYGGFLAIQAERGYKPGWAAVNYKEKFGDWPRAHGLREIASEPSPIVRSHIRSRMIRWAKRRKDD